MRLPLDLSIKNKKEGDLKKTDETSLDRPEMVPGTTCGRGEGSVDRRLDPLKQMSGVHRL